MPPYQQREQRQHAQNRTHRTVQTPNTSIANLQVICLRKKLPCCLLLASYGVFLSHREHVEQRGLPCARWAEQREYFAGLGGERDVVEDGQRALLGLHDVVGVAYLKCHCNIGDGREKPCADKRGDSRPG